MPQREKVEKVAELKARIEASSALFLADFRGLTVGDVTELRRALGSQGARFAVVKNTLMKRAAGEAGVQDLDPLLEGPTAVAFVDGDAVTAAKSLVDAIRRFRTMAIKGGYMEGRVLTPAQAESIATIEPREVLLARIAGGAKAQMARAAYMLQALQSRFVALLEAYRDKVPAGDGAASPRAEEAPGAGPEEVVAPEPAPAEGQPGTEVEEPAPDTGLPEEAVEEEAPIGESTEDQSVTEAQSGDGESVTEARVSAQEGEE